MWAVAYTHSRHVARKFPGAAPDAGCFGADSRGRAGVHDLAYYFCHIDGRIAFHAERIVAAIEKHWPRHGGDGRASTFDGGASNRHTRYYEPVSRVAAAQGNGGDFEAGPGIERGRHACVFG